MKRFFINFVLVVLLVLTFPLSLGQVRYWAMEPFTKNVETNTLKSCSFGNGVRLYAYGLCRVQPRVADLPVSGVCPDVGFRRQRCGRVDSGRELVTGVKK